MSKTADVIRVRRSQLRLSQDRLAELVGVTQRQIGRYESGEQSPSLAVSVRLSNALQVSLAELAGAEASETDLSGEWWVAWQYRRSGADHVNVHLLAVAQDDELLHVADGDRAHPVVDGSYTWRSELRLWGGEVLMGWYTTSGGSIRHIGTLYFALHPDGSQMIGSWTGLRPTGSLARGWTAIARDKDCAIQLVTSLIDTNGELPTWPERAIRSSR
ncbi:helix-turn-helix domain-containing protein [Nocardia sp. NBC_01329]|uniref:helix-turn-helix domain-containing protein n=1 Tax=Nocardia sp. NBC_01329 TaxID=2903594 RepID=UPI002E125B5E|nr:helix-turn-helix transcriptional regulator [Nocardia sp. NBC_01329]